MKPQMMTNPHQRRHLDWKMEKSLQSSKGQVVEEAAEDVVDMKCQFLHITMTLMETRLKEMITICRLLKLHAGVAAEVAEVVTICQCRKKVPKEKTIKSSHLKYRTSSQSLNLHTIEVVVVAVMREGEAWVVVAT